MSKPRILIPIPIQDNERRRYTLGKNYVHSVIASGGAPLLVPTALDDGTLRELYLAADGVLLTGGDDVDPALFDEEKHEKTGGIDADRDRMEIALTRWAAAENKPLLGICRGVQVMNVALGGSLIQDIPSQSPSELTHPGHWYSAARDQVLHNVCCDANTRLAGIIGFGDVGVNSFHHQSLKRVAEPFVVTARAPDGIVEAVEIPGNTFCVGVQWHPEEMAAGRPDMMRLFEGLVSASSA
jgi:putative glutamine amidotransferase